MAKRGRPESVIPREDKKMRIRSDVLRVLEKLFHDPLTGKMKQGALNGYFEQLAVNDLRKRQASGIKLLEEFKGG